MSPFHLPALDLFILGFGESELLGVVLKSKGDSVQLEFGHDSPVLGCGSRVVQDAVALVEMLLLYIDSSSISESATNNVSVDQVAERGKRRTVNGSNSMYSKDAIEEESRLWKLLKDFD